MGGSRRKLPLREQRLLSDPDVRTYTGKRQCLVDRRRKQTPLVGTVWSFAPLISKGGFRQWPSLKEVGPARKGVMAVAARSASGEARATPRTPCPCAARTRYDHIAGELEVAIADNPVKRARSSFRATPRM